MDSSTGCVSSGAEKNKGNIAYCLPCLASPLSFLYCVFFFAPCALDLNLPVIALSLPQTSRQGPAAVQEKVEDEKS